MCGRYTIAVSAEQLLAEFGIEPPAGFEPRYNVAPQQDVPVIGVGSDEKPRFALVRWGLVPGWAESPGAVKSTINARAETLLERPTFRDPFLRQRCLVIADGFFEWKRQDGTKQPWWFRLEDGRPFAFAGLWDRWQGAEQTLYSCAIVTTRANDTVSPVHDRMPVILDRQARDRWLDPDSPPGELNTLLAPLPDGVLAGTPVSTAVNSVANDSPECIRAV